MRTSPIFIMRVLTRSPQIKNTASRSSKTQETPNRVKPNGDLVPMLAVLDATLERARVGAGDSAARKVVIGTSRDSRGTD